jgi:hypothetical protein
MPYLRGIFESTLGILYMATPHFGSELVDNVVVEVFSRAMSIWKDTDRKLLQQLGTDSHSLREQHKAYIKICPRFNTTLFYEGKGVKVGITSKSIMVTYYYHAKLITRLSRNLLRFL